MADVLPVSVIITHCNRSDLLAGAIASVRRQTALPAQIIVVDDFSRPEHRAALGKFPEDIKIILLDKRSGAPVARNAGIAAATEEWIAFLDDDDEWYPGKLERQWQILRDDQSLDGVVSALNVVSSDRAPWIMTSHSPSIMTVAAALEDNLAMLQTALLRAADVRALGGLDEDLPLRDDHDFWIRFTAAGYRGFCDREPLVTLNRRKMKRLSTFWWGYVTSQFQVTKKHRALYEQVCGPGAVHRAHSTSICRAGLERGKIFGRVLYACGCIFGGDMARLGALISSGKMQIIPYGPE